jgi:hypothetical protein
MGLFMLQLQKTVLAWVLLSAPVLGMAQPQDGVRPHDLNYLERQFHPTEAPIRFEYAVAYRFLKMEISRLGTLALNTTVGQWVPQGGTNRVPAVFVDLAFNSGEGTGATRRARVSIRDRIVAVIGVPGMDALLFAKDTDEYLNPLIGRTRVLRSVSSYDVQSGTLDYWHFDLGTDTVVTNLSNPQAIVDLSRQLRPILEFLMGQCRGTGQETLSPDHLRININASGRVVPLRLRTVKERSPWQPGARRVDALRVDVLPAARSDARLYRFRGWAMPFQELAECLDDDALRRTSREAFVKAVVPVTAEYELALGAIRMTLVSAGQGTAKPASPQPGGIPMAESE